MFKTILSTSAVNVPIQYKIYDGNDLLDLSGYTGVFLKLNDNPASPITATVVSTGLVSVTFPSTAMIVGEYKAYFYATDNTSDVIPLKKNNGLVIVRDEWD